MKNMCDFVSSKFNKVRKVHEYNVISSLSHENLSFASACKKILKICPSPPFSWTGEFKYSSYWGVDWFCFGVYQDSVENFKKLSIHICGKRIILSPFFWIQSWLIFVERISPPLDQRLKAPLAYFYIKIYSSRILISIVFTKKKFNYIFLNKKFIKKYKIILLNKFFKVVLLKKWNKIVK